MRWPRRPRIARPPQFDPGAHAARRARRIAAFGFAVLAAIALVRAVRSVAPRGRCHGAWTHLDTTADCGACGVRCGAEHASAACVEGRCVLACAEGRADCDGHPNNSCEVDLKTDRAHCGLCSRSCAGARCEEGRCVARFVGSGSRIVVDAAAVYAVGATIVRYPLDGSDATLVELDAGPGAPATAATGALRIADAENVYWVEADPRGGAVVRRAPTLGGEAVTVVGHPAAIRDLAGNATHLFWVDEKQRIFMAPKKPR